MSGNLYCLIGFTLLFSSVFMLIMKQKHSLFIKFDKSLDDSQKRRYRDIIKERTKAYIYGMSLGILLGTLYYTKNKKDEYVICKLLAIIYSTKLLFYYFYPKQPLMLYSLTDNDQVKLWADIYTEMKKRWKISIALGFFAYIFIGIGCKKK
jgi:hypothetical protein